MNIQSVLNMVGPLTSKDIIDRLINLLADKGIHELSKSELSRIMLLSNSDCEEYLMERLSYYLSTGKTNKIRKEKTNNTYSHQYLHEHLGSSLKDEGYEYGLSDW